MTGPGRGTATGFGGADVSALFDNDSTTQATLPEWVQYTFPEAEQASFYTLTSGVGELAGNPTGWVLEGLTKGNVWKAIDKRTEENFQWARQTRPFKIHSPGAYEQYRIRFAGGTSPISLAEIELLAHEPPATSSLLIESAGVFGSAGETVTLAATVTNHATRPASGRLTATAPQGWTVQPASADLGSIAPNASKTVEFQVTVPATVTPGSHPIQLATGTASRQTTVTVLGDTVQFTPGTAAETPWLLEEGGSQLDGEVHDGRARFTDGNSHATYRFTLPAGVTGGSLTLDIGNQFLVQVSTDNQSWRTVLREDANVRDLGNRAERTLGLDEVRGAARTFYLRIADSQPQDGWGAWLARVRLELRSAG